MVELGREGEGFREDELLKSVSSYRRTSAAGRKPGSQEAEGVAHSSSPLRDRKGAIRVLVAFPPCMTTEFKS